MDNFDVLVFGSTIVDFIDYVERLPKPGETLHGKYFLTGFGGKGANQCVAASKLGAKTALISKVGDDDWGDKYITNLHKQNVNTKFVEKIVGEQTGIAHITVADNGDNQIVIMTGANKLLSSHDVARTTELFERSKILICQLETPVESTIEALKQFKGISILNAAPALESTPEALITLPSILCVNECEASLMTGYSVDNVQDAKIAIKKLLEMGAQTVVITLGALGAVYGKNTDDKVIHVKTEKINNVVDTTGAGDAFIGAMGYLLALYPNEELYKIISVACRVASKSVQSNGTQSSFPTATDVDITFDSNLSNWNQI